MSNPDLNVSKRDNLLLVLLALIAGVAFDYLFYAKMPGISYLIFVLLVLGIFWWSVREKIALGKSFGWFVLIPILLLSSTMALYSNPVLFAINWNLVPLLIVVHALLVAKSSKIWWEPGFAGDIVKRVLPLTIWNFNRPFLIIAEEFKPKDNNTVHQTGKKILIGLVISVPILLVVVPLLSSADMVFNYYLNNISKIREIIDLQNTFGQGFTVILVSFFIFGFLWSFREDHPAVTLEFKAFSWDSTIIATALVMINLVYLLFSIIQFSYLYGGGGSLLPEGFTYAEYARKGFWELVAVTVINLSIFLTGMKLVNKENRIAYLLVRILLSLLVIFSINMLVSANYKMSLYEAVYGLTYLRIFVHYFMALLLVLFLLALAKNFWPKVPLVKTYIVVTLVFYVVLNFINVDRIIARNNIKMFNKTGRIDYYYLQQLSDDAVPELIRFADRSSPEISRQIKANLVAKKLELSGPAPWQSFNYSRYKAKQALLEDYRAKAPGKTWTQLTPKSIKVK